MNATTTGTLDSALELGQDTWLLACATQAAEKPRDRALPARTRARLQEESATAKQRFHLSAEAPVCTGYEAGRDGLWRHRAVTTLGITNVVVDSGAIDVNRRKQHVQSDPVDAAKLLNLLGRSHGGERTGWSVVNVPSAADADRRQLHRGRKDLQGQPTACRNRITGVLASQGRAAPVDADVRTTLDGLRDWAGEPVPAGLRERVVQEFVVWEALHRQVRDAANAPERRRREGTEPYRDQVRRLMGLKAVGVRSAWILVTELFAGRDITNGKELGALVGLTPTPSARGPSEREQGISTAGNQHVRGLIVELAWLWRRWPPGRALRPWYQRRFGAGTKRARKVGLVALARTLLIALGRSVDQGELPAAATEKDGRLRVDSTAWRHAKTAAALAYGAAARHEPNRTWRSRRRGRCRGGRGSVVGEGRRGAAG
jgi:transposase